MFVDRLKAAIKSVPFLARLYYPLAFAYDRRARAMARARRCISSIAAEVSEPVFVNVGANDGVTADPLSDILLGDIRWKALLIEPVPYCFDRLKLKFGDSNRFSLEQVAIGAATATATFYYVAQNAIETFPDLPKTYDQLGSFNKNHILKHMNGVLAPFIVECTVEVRTLTDVVDRNGIRHFHLLRIDAEGSDFEVLKTLDLANRGPLAIFIEHTHLPSPQKDEMVRLLRRYGYSVLDCGEDYFAVRRRASPWKARLAA